MKIGFFTSTLNDRPVEEVLDFARSAGFDAVEFDARGHIQTPDNVAKTVEMAKSRGLEVCSIALTGNQLDPNAQKRHELRDETRRYAKAIADAGVSIIVIFPGRDETASEDDGYKSFADHADALLASTAASGLQIAIENWPGPKNDYLGVTPDGWRRLFALLPDRRFGLEFDPSHLIRLGIEPFKAFDEVKGRVKILHGKDTSIDAAALQELGYHARGWWRYRLPGSGLLDWTKFLSAAKASGFDGDISIEHEDSDFGWPRKDLEARKEGERRGLAFLRKTLAAL